jgi:RimJ/RimL family protein N-acetyltransferase
MMHPHFHSLLAQERSRDLRAADRSRARAIDPLRTLLVRDLRAADRDEFEAMFARLSPQSRLQRYLSPKPALTERELRYLTDVDHVRHSAVAAVEPGGQMVGVARYASYPEAGTIAEIAVEVVDHWQRRGVGTLLTARTIERAIANRLALLRASTMWENAAARALMARFGFRVLGSRDGLIELELPLTPRRSVPRLTRAPS